MDYQLYLKTAEWKEKKVDRLAFDNWLCGFCHANIDGIYETHHLNYMRLGHEDIARDLITLCPSCHKKFHEVWSKKDYWTASEAEHWNHFDLNETAKFCAEYRNRDYFFGGDLNLCCLDVINQCIDEYYSYHDISAPIFINSDDIRLYFRNARYEVIITSSERGEDIETMLDRKFGQKRVKGGNPIRAAARTFATKHKVPAMKRISKENKDILEITKKVNEIISKEIF